MSYQTDYIKKIDDTITQKIGPTFCMAKWNQTSIYLHTGQTHSCYHPKPHAISQEEIKIDPSALHNTSIKKAERQKMILGVKPDGCQYCWNIEALGTNHISDRKIRNAATYTPDRIQEILDNSQDFNINPEYVELAFSNECNFKCGYCTPMSSTTFFQEIKQHGPYNSVPNRNLDITWFNIIEENNNPYIQAWWKWWPELSKTLITLRLTGGEPLLHKSTWKLLDELSQNPKPQLELNINSNLGVNTKFIHKLVEHVNELMGQKKINKFKLFSSLDTWGQRAEYLRTGLDLKLWEHNLDTYIQGTKTHINIMSTFNILSVTSYVSFLEKILHWRKQYNNVIPILNSEQPSDRKIRFDTPYLKEPLHYDMHILPKAEYLPHFDLILKFIKDNTDDLDVTKFSELEYEKFRRVREYFATVQYDEAKVIEGRIDFYNWFTEHDRRRNVSFLETFPDMKNFWNLCQNLALRK